ncbi:phage tail protein [Limosilactobacillus pontis]|uniref:Phage tail protein n=1 Tax=Limosilactobacillus pontis TaxID=35787 RepID=A0ABT7UVE5_9LACO|nr:phage tail protein [Limosilactobacillus pontis]MDM8265668.1 phage tail protein [Limosilactobacillus pontis]
MLNLPIRSPAGNEAVVQAYDVAVTDTIKAYRTLNFSFIANDVNEAAEKMIMPRVIITDPTDGQQYRIATSNPVPSSMYRTYAVTCNQVGVDLHDSFIEDTITGSQSLKACCDLLTTGTNFKYVIDGDIADHDFGDDSLGKAHGDDILNTIAEAFNIEYWFDNYTIHLASSVGQKDQFVFIDRVNTSKIQVNEDYTVITTCIRGTGKEIDSEAAGGGGNLDSVEGFAKSPINADFGVNKDAMIQDFANRSDKVRARGVDVNRLYDTVKNAGVSPEWFFAYELQEQNSNMGWLNHWSYPHGDPYNDATVVCDWIKTTANSDSLNPAWSAAEGSVSADPNLTNKWNQEFGKGTIGRLYLQATAAAVWELAGTSGNASIGKPLAGCISTLKGWGGHTVQTASGGSGQVSAFARQYAGTPYVWGGSTPSGWDCSGFVAYIYNHFGIPMHQPTTFEEYQGQMVNPPYQEGDMLFWGARGNTYHVALALDSNTLEMAANPDRGTVIQAISDWPPDFAIRNAAMAAKVGSSGSDSDSDSSDDTTDQTPQYSCQGVYKSPMADPHKWGEIWADDFSSDTITDYDQLMAVLKTKVHDYPDVQYTTDWITFKDSLSRGIKNNVSIGNYGYLRDRYGIDTEVRIQSYTRYRDRNTTQADTITFGNKIFGIDEWNNRENQAKSALHKALKKPETVTPPVTADDIPTVQQKQKDDNKDEQSGRENS